MPITPMPAPPLRTAPLTFAALAEASLSAQATFVTEANALEANVNAKEVLASAAAVNAVAAEAVALAAANYKGPWASQSGAAAVPYAVSHLSKYWQLASNLADVSAKTPGTDAEWLEIVTTVYATAAEALAGASATSALSPATEWANIKNLKLVVNADPKKLDFFTQSAGAAPDANNVISVMFPDGAGGLVKRTRAGSVAGGNGQVTLADGVDYWGKGSTNVPVGTSTTRFDITNPSGTTARYTFDGTGVDPGLSATWPRIGGIVVFAAQNFNAANNGAFVVTGSGANYVEVTNAAVVAETDKTVGTGSIVILRPHSVALYAIYSEADEGVVLAAGGYSGFDKVPVGTAVGADDHFAYEGDTSYTPVNTDRCVCVGKAWKTYHVTDSPDHRLITVLEFAPQVIWNPKSDYGGEKSLATTNISGGDIAEYAVVSKEVKQSGEYIAIGIVTHVVDSSAGQGVTYIRSGSNIYAAAAQRAWSTGRLSYTSYYASPVAFFRGRLNNGDTIHLGAGVTGSGNKIIKGDDSILGATKLIFWRED